MSIASIKDYFGVLKARKHAEVLASTKDEIHELAGDLNPSHRGDIPCKVADTIDDAKALIETGFEYVCDLNNVQLFRKRK